MDKDSANKIFHTVNELLPGIRDFTSLYVKKVKLDVYITNFFEINEMAENDMYKEMTVVVDYLMQEFHKIERNIELCYEQEIVKNDSYKTIDLIYNEMIKLVDLEKNKKNMLWFEQDINNEEIDEIMSLIDDDAEERADYNRQNKLWLIPINNKQTFNNILSNVLNIINNNEEQKKLYDLYLQHRFKEESFEEYIERTKNEINNNSYRSMNELDSYESMIRRGR